MSILAIPSVFRALVDDAAIFPPGLASLPDAVVAHAEHVGSAHRDLVGPLVVGAGRLAELASLATAELYADGLRVSVVVPTPGAVAQAVAAVDAAERLKLAALEVKLDPARDAVEQVHAIAASDRRDAATYVEVPRPRHPDWPAVADAVAEHGLRLKFRTGGTEAAAFPSETEVATWLHDAVARRVPFKCTAGLHHALRHTGRDTGFEHHGYLNILLATARAASGADLPELVAVIGERSPRTLADAVAADEGVERAREWFTSYGSCSVLEPLEDLEDLNLITVTSTHS